MFLINFLLILVMQITKSKFALAARGVQLDNGVTSPCTDSIVSRIYVNTTQTP
jgi:hypothetical protein